MKLAWLTDIHLNFIEDILRQKFYQEIIKIDCDGILISGDIAEAPSVAEIMREMGSHIKKTIYFILGNHDYYRGQVDEVRTVMTSLTRGHSTCFGCQQQECRN